MAQTTSVLDPAVVDRAAAVIKCLGHPLRLLLLDAMRTGDVSVTELQSVTGSSQAVVSEQLAILRGHGIVAGRRDGPFMRYSITEPKVYRILDCVRGCGT